MTSSEPRLGCHRQPPEGVAVEVDQRRIVDDEAIAEAGERVGRVERLGVLPATVVQSPSQSITIAATTPRPRIDHLEVVDGPVARRARPRHRAAVPRSENDTLSSTGTFSSRSPCTSSIGTPIGSSAIGDARGVALGQLRRGRRRETSRSRRTTVPRDAASLEVGDTGEGTTSVTAPVALAAQTPGDHPPSGRSSTTRSSGSPAIVVSRVDAGTRRRRRSSASLRRPRPPGGTRGSPPPSRARRGRRTARP